MLGLRGEGELGDGSEENSDTPVEVQDLTGATEVSAGWVSHMRGAVERRKWNAGATAREGALGDGSEENSDTPVQVQDLTNATQVVSR